MKYLSIVLVLSLLVGCQAGPSDSSPKELQVSKEEYQSLTSELNSVKAELATERSKVEELEKRLGEYENTPSGNQNSTENEFIPALVADAFGRYWRVEFGEEGSEETFEENGVSYRYYASDIDTTEKMAGYLLEVYTDGISNLLVKDKSSKNGRLYHPDGGIGTLMNWERSTLLYCDTYPDGKSKTALLKVPTADDHYEVEAIKLFYVEGKGWRVATIPSY